MQKYILPLLVAFSVVLSIATYPYLPEKVPSHFGPSGAADAFSSKAMGAILFPAVMVFMYALYLVIPRIEVYKENLKSFEKEYFILFLLLHMFFLAIFLSSIIQAFSPFNMNYFIIPALAFLFYALGVLLPRFKRNYFVGVRTPWTLASEKVWDKTHQAAGKAFKAAGIITLLGLLFIDYSVYLLIASILAAAAYSVAYSYLEFSKLGKKRPASRKKQ